MVRIRGEAARSQVFGGVGELHVGPRCPPQAKLKALLARRRAKAVLEVHFSCGIFLFCFACGMRFWSVVRCLYNNTATQTRRRNLALALAQGGGGVRARPREGSKEGKGGWEGKGSGRKAVCMCGIIRRCSPPSLSALWPFQVITSGQYSCHGTSQGLPRHYTIPHTHHASLLPPLYSDDFKSDRAAWIVALSFALSSYSSVLRIHFRSGRHRVNST